MNRASTNLRERLAAINLLAERVTPAGDTSAIRAETRKIKSVLGGLGGSAGAPRDRIHEEVARFRTSGDLTNAKAARLVCWGTTLASDHELMLMEDTVRFPRLLAKVDEFRVETRPYRRCWRGLLEGYLTYDPDRGVGAGKSNWELLRSYLRDSQSSLDRTGFSPDWLGIIDEHRNLITDQPCERYGLDLLNGNSDVLEPLRSTLGITDDSWVIRRTIEAQISRALILNDDQLREALPRLIALLQKHEFLADAGLSRLLDRYVTCEPLVVSPEIRDYAVMKWGNPWLERNDAHWSRVDDSSRKMVSDWIKLANIEHFFSLLSADRQNDARRLAFWKRYHNQMSDMYFAFGDTAARNTSADFKTLKQRMLGRILRLDNGGTPNNNAFIMRIASFIFVEFGEKGNAMFVFDGKAPPFSLSRSRIEGNKVALKHASHVERIIHVDSKGETWEYKIAASIERLTGCRPNDAGHAQGPVAGSAGARHMSQKSPVALTPPPRGTTSSWQPARTQSSMPSDVELREFLSANRVETVDLRSKGGSLWIHAAQHSVVGRQLRDWDFVWSERRAAWYGKAD